MVSPVGAGVGGQVQPARGRRGPAAVAVEDHDLAGGLAGVVSLEHGLGVALQQLDGGLAVEPAR